jgi:thiol-disulfide isomerase/thioredoxin
MKERFLKHIFKPFIFILLSVSLASCGYPIISGGLKPVYFIADANLFRDTLYPVQTVSFNVSFGNLNEGETHLELREGETIQGFMRKPTIVHKGSLDQALVYPKEHIHISGDYENDDFTFSSLDGSAQRNRELMVLKAFLRLRIGVPVRLLTAPPGYTLGSLLEIEKNIKEVIPDVRARSQKKFDSLLTVYGTSKKFKNQLRGYRNNYNGALLTFYKMYKDTLAAHHLYYEKLRQLIPAINLIKRDDFDENNRQYVNDVVLQLFPHNLMISMADENMFRSCFDSINNSFSGWVKGYLLTRVMTKAYTKGLDIPTEYTKIYRHSSVTGEYRKMVGRAKKQRRKNNIDTLGVATRLLAVDGKDSYSLEELMTKYNGRYVLMDVWASWCGPCLKEVPSWKKLIQSYSSDKIVFLSMSIDKQTADWHRAILKSGMQSFNNYLLLNASQSQLTKQYKLESLPRYLLFDKKGHILNADAPGPNEPALTELLNKLTGEPG